MTFEQLLVGFLVFIMSLTQPLSAVLDGSLLGIIQDKLFEKALTKEKFQDRVYDHYRRTSIVDGKAIVNEITDNMKSILLNHVDAVRKFAKGVDDNYQQAGGTPTYLQCANIDTQNKSYDYDFQSKVDGSRLCFTNVKANVSSVAHFTIEGAFNLVNILKANVRNVPSINFQYIASTDGQFFIYPASQIVQTPFDPRWRPWYSQAVNARPRDVIIIMDSSTKLLSSIFGQISLTTAIQIVVKNIVGAMTSRDRVALIPFSEPYSYTKDLEDMNTCFLDHLTYASEQIKSDITSFLRALTQSGPSNYAPAIKKALNIFQKELLLNHNKSIVFITGVMPDDSRGDHMYELQQVTSNSWKNTAAPYILAFILDPSSNVSNYVAGLLPRYQGPSKVVGLPDILSIERNLPIFYDIFDNPVDEIRLTPIYADAANRSSLVTMTKPFYDDGKLLGVIGVDISLNTLFSPALKSVLGRDSYPFVFDRSDLNTYIHRMLPVPYEIDLEPALHKFDVLEKFTDDTMIPKLQSNGDGVCSVKAVRFFPIGNPFTQGSTNKSISSEYFYTPLTLLNINWTIGFALSESDKSMDLLDFSDIVITFFYHRMDMDVQNNAESIVLEDPCTVFKTRTTKGVSSVKFAPRSFLDPVKYLFKCETGQDVEHYMDIVHGLEDNDIFQEGVVDDVIITSELGSLWRTSGTSDDFITYAIWRYIGTERGVFRIFLPVMVSKEFDPTTRVWYRTAMSYEGVPVITTPYIDDNGAGYIVTAAQTIYRRAAETMLGVLAVDVTVNYLQTLVETAYEDKCNTPDNHCFLIDTTGHLISYWKWLSNAWVDDVQLLKDAHITTMEPRIAQHMIRHGHMKSKICMDLFNNMDHKMFEIDLKEVDYMNDIDGGYMASFVNNTNLYVVVYNYMMTGNSSACNCNTSMCSPGLDDCECPCSMPSSCSSWDQEFHIEDWILCAYPTYVPIGVMSSINNVEPIYTLTTDRLPPCINVDCSTYNDLRSCFSVVTCRWCTLDKYGSMLAKPYCAASNVCWYGPVLKNQAPLQLSDLMEEKLRGGSRGPLTLIIYLAAVAVLIGLAFLVAVMMTKKICIFARRTPSADFREIESIIKNLNERKKIAMKSQNDPQNAFDHRQPELQNAQHELEPHDTVKNAEPQLTKSHTAHVNRQNEALHANTEILRSDFNLVANDMHLHQTGTNVLDQSLAVVMDLAASINNDSSSTIANAENIGGKDIVMPVDVVDLSESVVENVAIALNVDEEDLSKSAKDAQKYGNQLFSILTEEGSHLKSEAFAISASTSNLVSDKIGGQKLNSSRNVQGTNDDPTASKVNVKKTVSGSHALY